MNPTDCQCRLLISHYLPREIVKIIQNYSAAKQTRIEGDDYVFYPEWDTIIPHFILDIYREDHKIEPTIWMTIDFRDLDEFINSEYVPDYEDFNGEEAPYGWFESFYQNRLPEILTDIRRLWDRPICDHSLKN
jgi:hypothetical protein